MGLSGPEFNTGDIVALKADPSRKGPVIELLPRVQGKYRYRVFHSPEEIREYVGDQIFLLPPPKHIVREKGIKIEEFIACLNSIGLNFPQVDSIYALHAARIKFISFQFKPLLRFLNAEEPRLLIADEVGVGKTIEAGLILRELQSRQKLESILIVCPKALVQKWKAEMKRFDENFQVLNTETLRYCLRETHLDGIWPTQYARSIVHLELLRLESYLMDTQGRRPRPGLLTLNPPPQFDLLIVDEAHHLRTPDTNTYELARFLCDISEAVLFLTATPLQLGSRNLFTLLNLLRPDQFIDEILFQEMVEPNRYLNQAIRHVRSKQPEDSWYNDAYQCLNDVANTTWGKSVLIHDPGLSEWLIRFQEDSEIIDEERIRFIRDMESVHTLAHIMNRTRRRDIGKFTIRQPFTISAPFTSEEQRFYDAIISFRRKVLALRYEPHLINLITDILERQAASCLHALLPTLDTFIGTGRFTETAITDNPESDEDVKLPQNLIEKASELKELASSLPKKDPKLDNLMHIVSETMNSEGPGKVLIFSFFLHTLSYLEYNLQQKNHRVAVVNGQVPDEEREILRNRFRLNKDDSDAIDVLLSSEVGCEGLDYEFCSCLVNYDIPWNPMRIEQRIGRIDRFGQMSETIQIYNFITPGTIEERVFFRCFDRLGIFRDTIGDMEEILGDLTEELTQTVLDHTLTPEQAENKAQQLADNALRRVEEQRRLEKKSAELLGLDRIFQEEVEEAQREGRYVTPDELKQMIALYLEHKCQNARIPTDDKESRLKLRANRADKDKLLDDLSRLEIQDHQRVEFTRWLEGDDPYLTVTFNQETALEHRDILFITPIHPLVKMAVSYWTNREDPLFIQVEVEDDELESGVYVFAYYLWETISLRSDLRLIPLVWSLKDDKHSDAISERLSSLWMSTHPLTASLSIPQEKLEQSLHRLEEFIHKKRSEEVKKMREKNYRQVEQRLESLKRYYQRRFDKLTELLDTTTDERICRMKKSEQARIMRDWERKKNEIEARNETDIISQRVAYGIMEVK